MRSECAWRFSRYHALELERSARTPRASPISTTIIRYFNDPRTVRYTRSASADGSIATQFGFSVPCLGAALSCERE